MLVQVGTTTAGQPVLAGLYRLYETNGTPLSIIIERCAREGAVPSWIAMVKECMAAGMKSAAATSKVEAAMFDGWPTDRELIAQGLRRLIAQGLRRLLALGLFD